MRKNEKEIMIQVTLGNVETVDFNSELDYTSQLAEYRWFAESDLNGGRAWQLRKKRCFKIL